MIVFAMGESKFASRSGQDPPLRYEREIPLRRERPSSPTRLCDVQWATSTTIRVGSVKAETEKAGCSPFKPMNACVTPFP